MSDDQKNQSKNAQTQQNKPVEDRFSVNPGPSSGIRSSLLSAQVNSKPLVDEGVFANSSASQNPAKEVVTTRKINSKLVGLVSIMALLFLAGTGLFFAYAAYRTSFNKIQNSKLSNNVDTTAVDLGGVTPTSSTLQGVGLLQVNGDANITNTVTANSFSGGGADLTNLNATNITSGTLNDARLSPNVALLDANQTFTGSNNFTGPTSFTGAVVLPGTLTINSITYNMPATQSAGTLTNDGSGNLYWQPAGACPTCVNTGGNAYGAAMTVGTLDNNNLSFITNGTTRLTFDTTGNATFTGTLSGNGSGLTNLNGTNITSGTVADARLTSNVTLLGNVFNGALELVQLDAAGALPALNGAALTNLDASHITVGTLNDLRLSSNVTLMGNTFNLPSKLVQLTAAGFLPALNASLLTNLNATNIASGTLSDSRLSANVALLNAANTFTANNTFSSGITTNSVTTTSGLTVGSTSQSLVLQGNGSTSITSTSGGHTTTLMFQGVPVGNITYHLDTATTPGTYDICTSIGNCAGAGGGVTTLGGTTNKLARFTGLQSIGDSSISDDGEFITIQPTIADNVDTFKVLNTTGSTTVFDVDTTNSRIGIGTATPGYAVDAVGDINSSTGLRVGGTLVCNNTGCVSASGSTFYIQNTTTVQSGANFAIQSAAAGSVGGVIRGAAAQTADLQQWQSSGAAVLASVDASGNINTTGQFRVGGVQISSANLSNDANLAKLDGTQSFTGVNTFQNSADSTAAFKIQNAAGTSNLLTADTSNTRIGIGTSTPGYTLDVNGDVNLSTGSLYRINGVAICGATGTCAPSANSPYYIWNSTSQQTNANFNIVSTDAGSVTGILQGAVGQTANILEIRNGSGSQVANFTKDGVLTLGNDNASPQAGSIVFHDGTGVNSFTNTLNTATLTANRSVSLPDESGTICLQNSTQCGFALSSGNNNYIQNQSAATQTADFKISGNGTLATLTASGAIKTTGGTVQINDNGTLGTVEKLRVNGPTTTDNLTNVMFATDATTSKGLVIQAKASQTANLQEWQNSAGTALSVVSSSGWLGIGSSSAPTAQLMVTGNTASDTYNGVTASTPVMVLKSSDGTTRIEFRANTATGATFMGVDTGRLNTTTGTYNTGIGYNVLYSNQSGQFNTGLGYYALRNNTGGSNTAIGYNALFTNTSGSYNTAVGASALSLNSTGANNTAVGFEALKVSTGSNNTAVGYQTLLANTSGNNNTAVGAGALSTNITGGNNTALGYRSLYSNTASNNTAIGYQASYTNSTGTNNTAFGYNTLYLNSTGNNNTAVGNNALYNNTASDNTGIGYNALTNNTSGTSNTAVGISALQANQTGSYNVAIGNSALPATTSSGNTGIGYGALNSNTSGANNTAVGYQAAATQTNLGFNTTAVGYQALYTNAATNNTALGYQAMYLNTSGTGNMASGTQALYSNTSGIGNVAVGYTALYNTAGAGADYNIGLGYNARTLNAADTNSIVIGYNAVGLGSNTTVIGNSSTTSTVLWGNLGVGTTNPVTKLDVVSTDAAITAGSFVIGRAYTIQSVGTTNFTLIGASANTVGVTFIATGAGTGTGTATVPTAQFRNSVSAVTCVVSPISSSGFFSCSSDARLKTNVLSITDPTDVLTKLRGVNFNWISQPDGLTQSGFIAQELMDVLPNAVSADSQGYLVANYQAIIPYLVEGFKKQQTQIDNLTATTPDVIKTLADANAIELKGDLTIGGNLVVGGNTSFSGDVTFSSDSAGTVTMPAGTTTKHITFTKTLSKTPVVSATPKDFITGSFKVTNESTTGFDIQLEQSQAGDSVFNWRAVLTK